MPRYSYKCLNEKCEYLFEVVHSMKEKVHSCYQCSGSVERIPSTEINISKKDNLESKQKVGSLVKKNIEEFRQDLKNEKKKLREKEYK